METVENVDKKRELKEALKNQGFRRSQFLHMLHSATWKSVDKVERGSDFDAKQRKISGFKCEKKELKFVNKKVRKSTRSGLQIAEEKKI